LAQAGFQNLYDEHSNEESSIYNSLFIQHLSQARRDQAMKQRVLITGGAHGIGKASAQRCVAEGYEVLIIDQTGDGIRADLSCPDQTAEALEKALKTWPDYALAQ